MESVDIEETHNNKGEAMDIDMNGMACMAKNKEKVLSHKNRIAVWQNKSIAVKVYKVFGKGFEEIN